MMRNIFKINNLLLLGLVLSFGLVTSCEEEETTSSKVELYSYGPVGKTHGDTIKFIGANLNKVVQVNFEGDSVLKANFIEQSADIIKLKIPTKAESGLVVLKTDNEEIVTKTAINFEVVVNIASISEVVRPEGTMVIKGDFVNWITSVRFPKDLVVNDTDFVSVSLNEVVIPVPKEAKTGTVEISYGGTEPDVLSYDISVVLPSITSFGPNPIEHGATLSIIGNDLDLVKAILFKGVASPVEEFLSQSATEIQVAVPANTTKGFLTLVAFSDEQVLSAEKLLIVGDLPDPTPLSYIFYGDALQNGWGDWGWGSSRDFASVATVREGDKSIKATFSAGWGAIYLGGGNASTTGKTTLAFSVYGDVGTEGKELLVSLNWGAEKKIAIQEGKWTDVEIPLSELGSPAAITDLVLKEAQFSGVVYFDYIGLR